MTEPAQVTADYLRQYYAKLGLLLSEQELEGLVPVVQALFDGARQVEELFMLEQEPGTVFQLQDER
ncbi:MAG TPA: hypothetical protein VJM51_02055 [Dehalococcoidia bacterium]|nr:hypothetical protein [Dehalococcoidia bacterium]